jgi:hypothetical protein
MPESAKEKPNSNEAQPKTEFAKFQALASAFFQVPKEEIAAKRRKPKSRKKPN